MADGSENRGGQMEKKKENEGHKLEGLPVNTSPYTQYKDLEDYKQQGYGTQGHLQPQPGRGAASSVDAPTEAGADVSSTTQLSTTNVINRRGVP
ncbi:hypothetical protein ACH5RR_011513 [Cinchona calisaya]|uniref:Late embryogenesis abundant protein, LEA-18 n=1 Tax=Cinchona calisaya TaxID=153742 RepID=A0ABD3A558_9GENT